MASTRLDQALLGKVAKKYGKKIKYVREQVSKRASRLNVAAEVALILWAKEFGIGTASYQRQLEPHLQQQVSTALPTLFVDRSGPLPKSKAKGRKSVSSGSALGAAIDYLLSDEELRRRCADLLKARRHFDRVFREATTVLDDRLKRLGQIKGKVNPSELVVRVLHPSKAILVVSDYPEEQEGFFSICKGLMFAFRNPTHHSLNDKLTREDALRFCGFVDALLTILKQARVNTQGG